mmetsp:Transcript_57376/g.62003  ORF Transcript_57376/g.62003 Transcript_57376/m.62003 type:complete len:199 (+) Transcript_57376:505-1101(+)
MIIKIKGYRWYTKDLTEELPSAISIACFVPFGNKKDTVDIQNDSARVTKDAQLDQPEMFCSKIATSIHESYKVNSTYVMLSTISSFLAFLCNLANFNNNVRPMLCDFLEVVLYDLTKESRKAWLYTHKECKHLSLCILSQIQQIIINFVLAASDDENYPNDDDPGATTSTSFRNGGESNLVVRNRLITMFKCELSRAI